MDNRFTNFNEKRLELFRKVIRKKWENNLNNETLNQIVYDFADKYNFQEDEISFLKDHVRVILGQNPTQKQTFNDELKYLKKNKPVESPILTKIDGICDKCGEEFEKCKCHNTCKYEAQMYVKSRGPVIIEEDCLSCGRCTVNCNFGALADKIEFIPLIDLLKQDQTPVFAAVAPSIVGQFQDSSMGQLRTALKNIGFEDMVEVALFADILTIKEAYEFDNLVTSKEDFFLTSCCCPVWINLVEKNYPQLFHYMSPSISPMIASGRFLKELYPESQVVFIGPCTAKKSEAEKPELRDAIDFVLTFQELKEIFIASDFKINELTEEEKDQASFAGRIYARTGGVSLSVKTIVNRIAPDRLIKLKSKRVHGAKNCKDILEKLKNSKEEIQANFIEGMGCQGGCVGGPKTNIEVDQATDSVNQFGENSVIMTPMDNMNIIKILKNIGLNDFEDIYNKDKIVKLLTRKIEQPVTK
ncbi:MAG: [Fe-Fe] hydrogenase large subunit C-terminal domain-containing protein [Halanaerobiales bacterium]